MNPIVYENKPNSIYTTPLKENELNRRIKEASHHEQNQLSPHSYDLLIIAIDIHRIQYDKDQSDEERLRFQS